MEACNSQNTKLLELGFQAVMIHGAGKVRFERLLQR